MVYGVNDPVSSVVINNQDFGNFSYDKSFKVNKTLLRVKMLRLTKRNIIS